MSIDPEQSKVRYFTKQFDLMTDKIPQREKINVTLAPPFDGDELNLERVQFKSMSYELEPTSETELKKLVRLIKSNPELNFEIQVLLTGYEEDSVKSSPDLTEVLVDSVHTQVDDIDSLGQIFKRDTVIAKTTYHNDRTQLQAKTIVDTLIRMGVNPESLQVLTNALPAVLPDSRKLVIKALARSRTGQ